MRIIRFPGTASYALTAFHVLGAGKPMPRGVNTALFTFPFRGWQVGLPLMYIHAPIHLPPSRLFHILPLQVHHIPQTTFGKFSSAPQYLTFPSVGVSISTPFVTAPPNSSITAYYSTSATSICSLSYPSLLLW